MNEYEKYFLFNLTDEEKEKEEWKDVVDFEGYYQISNLGRVRNSKTKSIKSFSDNGRGYLKMPLYKDGTSKTKYLHRMVAESFLEKPLSLNKNQVNHKDGNKKNNKVENLEWATPSENNIHSFDNNLSLHGEVSSSATLTNQEVLEIIQEKEILTIKELAEKYKTSSNVIRKILNGETWVRVSGVSKEDMKTGKETKGKKLTVEQVIEIKKKIQENEQTNTEISKEYNISAKTISDIRNNKTWKWVEIE